MLSVDLQKCLRGAAGELPLSVQFQLADHGILCLYGVSGAGKTSLLRMLAGLTVPDQGRIEFDGEIWFDSSAGIHLKPQRRAIGMVFQDYALFPHLNVLENVAFAAQKSDKSWVQKLLSLTGLAELQTRAVQMLSGGQKQRVAVARALARRPKLLLLDEALAALDREMRESLQDALLRIHKECGLSTVFVSHDLGEVFKLAKTVVHIENGKVLACGSATEVFLQNNLSGKLNLQARVLAIRREEIVVILSLLVGQEMIEIIAQTDDAKRLKVGDHITISTKAFSPLIQKY
ncbi:MAG: ATP-binding cassette domain-containing protein [Undibacterium sp.]|nr:ATP-binding cassette domain-containing protein [Undibacterium sp.]